ncbi:dicarboxylate/amino acid:cation symporter [Sphingobium algorifonticola]|uniref:Cation:dicarboxylase symporter family transporter n=1 Tax=Sphingobium algorifonticola TaxID=2008318 RepID=A0A437JCZ1_9SPHN|nr:cation:dicarboxylase symporter family transporter [Sphingobium algorifonticola]RVT43789.1 cation:dicarboxylase symporter family transporter [Sphingobium algorifonticola]
MSQTSRILFALVVGIAVGIIGARMGWGTAATIAEPIGNLWLDALRMTVVPLVISLLVTGIGRTADSARGGALALRSVVLFIGLLWLVTLIAALLIPALLRLWPMPSASAAALNAALGQSREVVGAAPGLADFLRSIVPTNPIAAAANDAMLPLILFATLFAIATTRLDADARDRITGLFGAIEKAMLEIVNWVLWIAPLGVFALAFVVGMKAGTAAIGALAHYIVIVSCAGLAAWSLAYPMALFGGRVRLRDFVRAVAPAQAVALSTQSSLASLPAMLRGCQQLGVPTDVAGVPLPIAVAIFRVTSPAMNLAVALYVAHWVGMDLSAGAIAAGAVVAAVTTLGSISLPGQVSFLTSITPIALAMGVPLAPLALLVAVEMIPDLVRTIGNVTMDVAATTALARRQDRNL